MKLLKLIEKLEKRDAEIAVLHSENLRLLNKIESLKEEIEILKKIN